jgi:hypothetical protein
MKHKTKNLKSDSKPVIQQSASIAMELAQPQRCKKHLGLAKQQKTQPV